MWSIIQTTTLMEIAHEPFILSPRFLARRANQNASSRNIAPRPASQITHTVGSPAVTDSRLTTTPLRACAKRPMSSVTVCARKAVHAPLPAQLKRRSDGSAVVLAQRRDPNGLLAACMAAVPTHMNVSTLPVISKAVCARIISFVYVKLTASSLLVSP